MKPKKQKANDEPTLLDQLNGPLRDFVADIRAHGVSTFQRLREESPAKNIELSTRLIALIATLKTPQDEIQSAKTLEDIGRGLLKSVGCDEDWMTESVVAEAVAANDVLIATLESIRNKAEGQTH
jgi:hypothetical protein